MKVIVSPPKAAIVSNDPNQLLAGMKARMAQKEPKGKIKTWECDTDGDFRYLASQYDGVAWVRTSVIQGAIQLKLVWPVDTEPSQEVKGIFLGRFIEMVLGHFTSSEFSEAKANPLP